MWPCLLPSMTMLALFFSLARCVGRGTRVRTNADVTYRALRTLSELQHFHELLLELQKAPLLIKHGDDGGVVGARKAVAEPGNHVGHLADFLERASVHAPLH